MYRLIFTTMLVLQAIMCLSQSFLRTEWSKEGFIQGIRTSNEFLEPLENTPVVSFVLDGQTYSINHGNKTGEYWHFNEKLSLRIVPEPDNSSTWKARLEFRNISNDTIVLENILIFGESAEKHYITGYGVHWLSRTRLFRPGSSSVPVILPDNAWELGYSDLPLDHPTLSAAGLNRRLEWKNAQRKRFETILFPGGEVSYRGYVELYEGDWQEGLRRIFQKQWIYDLVSFDNQLYERDDLKWIRDKYVIHLIMAWDHHFTDQTNENFRLAEFVKRGKNWYGGDDVIGIWPTWPALGMDQRNQWDLFRDLPGGLSGLQELVDSLHYHDIRFFICYNPWDESTRLEDHLKGLADIIKATKADGVVLDTRGSSSLALQAAADSVKKGVIMYSEGMSVPKDMPGIISGRVHNALYYPPILNLNKFIKPEFSIFRVAELTHEPIRREYSLCLFNGHGVEINMFRPGQPDWIEEDYLHLGRIARILRDNSHNFHSKDYTPLYPSLKDSVYINYWPSEEKEIYTLFGLYPEGLEEPLLMVNTDTGQHIIDLWNHEELILTGDTVVLKMDAFHQSDLGTNNEGSVSAIAVFNDYLDLKWDSPNLIVEANTGTGLKIWTGDPDYNNLPLELEIGLHRLNLTKVFPRFEGKIVIQLFRMNELIDERIFILEPGTPILISGPEETIEVNKAPEGMVFIPGGDYKWFTTYGDDFIGYPVSDTNKVHRIQPFFMDEFPVTNGNYQEFLTKTGYWPENDHNFLKHWEYGNIPEGREKFPVVNISLEDAKAYADWTGKRLPTEIEWQYAAQAGTRNPWPWGMRFDSTMTNTGAGEAYRVGNYPEAANPWGLEDLCGQVWQMTNDLYESGSYRYQIVKGGSYFKPSSSWWYVQGGPQPLPYRQMLLMVSDGFDRQGTVGFRCVVDIKDGRIKN